MASIWCLQDDAGWDPGSLEKEHLFCPCCSLQSLQLNLRGVKEERQWGLILGEVKVQLHGNHLCSWVDASLFKLASLLWMTGLLSYDWLMTSFPKSLETFLTYFCLCVQRYRCYLCYLCCIPILLFVLLQETALLKSTVFKRHNFTWKK